MSAKRKRSTLPKVTVLMPVYNGEKYLKEAIDSILTQTFTDFEFLIINDGSTDKTERIIKSYTDQRIKLIKNKVNKGIVTALNKGIRLAKGEYIARMDCDDLSLPKRLESEVTFLDKNPEYGLVGTLRYIMNEKRKKQVVAPAVFDHEDIKLHFAFGNIITHGSVMMRRHILIKHKILYNPKAKYFEDYDLWVKVANISKIANLPQVHYLWMNNHQGITAQNSIEMDQKARKFQSKLCRKAELPPLTLGKIKRYWLQSHLKINDKKVQTLFKEGYQSYLAKYAILSFTRRHIFQFLSLATLCFLISPRGYTEYVFKITKSTLHPRRFIHLVYILAPGLKDFVHQWYKPYHNNDSLSN